jgi:MFS superfamily sulfate permease-like transporter
MNWHTFMISFSALGVLVLLRSIKGLFKNYAFIYRLPEVLIVVGVSTCKCSSAVSISVNLTARLVLSSEFRWDKEGVDILGEVDITTGSSFFQFPLHGGNIGYLRRTTSTAVYV